MRALVTGGLGLIGSHVVDRLRAEGAAVTVLDSLASPTHHGTPDWKRRDVDYVIGDIRDHRVLAKGLHGVDTVIHLAAFGGFAPGLSAYFDVNVQAFARLLEVARDVAPDLRRVVVASTQAVYGEGIAECSEHGRFHSPRADADLAAGRWHVPCPVCSAPARSALTGEDDLAARTPYAVSKRCLEEVALSMPPEGGSAVVLRFALTYGRRQSAANPYCGIVPLFLQRMRRDADVLVYEDGDQTRDLCHVTDVAAAVVLAATDPGAAGGTFNVGTGRATSIDTLIGIIAQGAGLEPRITKPGWYRSGEVRHLVTDPTRILSLGWRPLVSVEDGIGDVCEWFLNRPLGADPFPEGLKDMTSAGVVRHAAPAALLATAGRTS